MIVTAHPGLDFDKVLATAPLVVDFRGVTRGIERAQPGASVTPTRQGRRRRPRLLGPEPRPQLRPRCRARSCAWICDGVAGGARPLERRASRDARDRDRRRRAARGRRRSTRSWSPRPCRRTPSSRCRRSRRASTASSRSRWRSRSADAEQVAAAARERRQGPDGRATCSSTTRASSKLKEIADAGELGDIHYIYGNRLNLGKLRADENALWSLGAHDVSVVLRLVGRGAVRGAARSARATCGRGSRTSSSASCASRRASPRTCTCPGSTRTRSAASPSSARSGWRRSTTWRSSARSRSTTRASTRTSRRTASTSRARATSTARASRTRSRCGSSAATSSSASPRGAAPRSGAESGVRVVRVLEALQDSLAETSRAATV